MKRLWWFLFLPFLFTGCFCNTGNVPDCETDRDCASRLFRCVAGQCLRSLGGIDGTVTDGAPGDQKTPEKGPACTGEGSRRACYTGPTGTAGVGLCTAGEQVCEGGFWSACAGQTLPAPELCDGQDNNCDGKIDETCQTCQPGETRPCYDGPSANRGKGTCKEGTQTCLATGEWGGCVGAVKPTIELCNKLDDDCNGVIDNGCKQCVPSSVRNCYPAGQAACTQVNGKWSCKGLCKIGNQTCLPQGTWSVCQGYLLPRKEVCNNTDDDCDGAVDNHLTPPACNFPLGVCAGAKKRCGGAQGWLNCTVADYKRHNPKYEPIESICDGIDNDCNGVVDDKCNNQCVPGTKRSCYGGAAGTAGKGTCKTGTQTCQGNRTWTACLGQVTPVGEVCNNLDDDCDGFVDENFPQQSQACNTGRPGICATGLYVCNTGKLVCQSLQQPRVEICNGKDDNCNGQIDEGAARFTFYRDADGDGYGDPKAPVKACRQPAGTVSNNRDCYDKNKYVFPGNPYFFSRHRGDGSFDYNCDGVQQPRFVKEGSCGGCQSPVITVGFQKPFPACGTAGKWVDKCRSDVGKCYPVLISKVQECR